MVQVSGGIPKQTNGREHLRKGGKESRDKVRPGYEFEDK